MTSGDAALKAEPRNYQVISSTVFRLQKIYVPYRQGEAASVVPPGLLLYCARLLILLLLVLLLGQQTSPPRLARGAGGWGGGEQKLKTKNEKSEK